MPGWCSPAWIRTSTNSPTPRSRWALVSPAPLWSVFGLIGILLALTTLAAVLATRISARPGAAPVGWGAPLRVGVRLLVQQRRTTIHPDALLWRIGGGALLVVAALMLVVVPLGHWVVSDLDIGIVWFNTMDITLWAVVWLAGWGANAHFAMVGAYRWLAQALAYGLPLMFAITAPALAAGSLRVTTVVAAQQHLWYVLLMPLDFGIFLIAVAGFSQWGPFGHPLGPDIGGGVLADVAGVDRLVVLVGRYALLAAGSAFAAAVFLGAGNGPLLPAWLWSVTKTLAVLVVVLAVRGRLSTLRMERFTEIGWLVLLPLSLLQLLEVALLVQFRLV